MAYVAYGASWTPLQLGLLYLPQYLLVHLVHLGHGYLVHEGDGAGHRVLGHLALQEIHVVIFLHLAPLTLLELDENHDPLAAGSIRVGNADCRRDIGGRVRVEEVVDLPGVDLSLIHISEPTRLGMISYAVFCLKKKKQ